VFRMLCYHSFQVLVQRLVFSATHARRIKSNGIIA